MLLIVTQPTKGDTTMTISNTQTVSQPLTKRRKPRREYKRLPKSTTSHFEWRGNAFVEVFTVHGRRYTKQYRPNTPKATTTINQQYYN